jgi:hypothetical protein
MIEALIGDNWTQRGIKILWRRDQGAHVEYHNGREAVTNPPPNVEVDLEPLVLDDDAARALLSALLRHYDGGEDTRTLRRDYDAERKRVDQFIAHLTKGQP